MDNLKQLLDECLEKCYYLIKLIEEKYENK